MITTQTLCKYKLQLFRVTAHIQKIHCYYTALQLFCNRLPDWQSLLWSRNWHGAPKQVLHSIPHPNLTKGVFSNSDLFQLEETWKGLWSNLHLQTGTAIRSQQLTQGFIQVCLENFKGQRLHLSGLPIPPVVHPHSESSTLHQATTSPASFVSIHGYFLSASHHTWLWSVWHQPLVNFLASTEGLLWLNKLPQHFINNLPALVGLKQDTAFQKQPNMCQLEKKNHFPWFAGYAPAHTASYASMPGRTVGTCLAHCPSGPPGAFSSVVPSSLYHCSVQAQVQNFTFVFSASLVEVWGVWWPIPAYS